MSHKPKIWIVSKKIAVYLGQYFIFATTLDKQHNNQKFARIPDMDDEKYFTIWVYEVVKRQVCQHT